MKNSNMKWVLIGHRGVGKTTFLSRLSKYNGIDESDVVYLDLDQEIEKKMQLSISAIFLKYGEEKFRLLEKEIFYQLYQEHSKFVMALGAGFNISELPSEVQKIWIRRETDRLGRIFLNRPRLDEKRKPLEEYLERYLNRQKTFTSYADQTYWIPEGLQETTDIEAAFFKIKSKMKCGGIRTLTENDFIKQGDGQNFLKPHVLRFIPDYFELRTDLLSENLLKSAVEILTKNSAKILLSFRSLEVSDYLISLTKQNPILWDWASELGNCKFGTPKIVSLHQYEDQQKTQQEGSLESALLALENNFDSEIHLKIAPEIKTWKDLEILYSWQQKKPSHRSILPRSVDGKWKWFRLRMKNWQLLNFWKESNDLVPDQPNIYEWLLTPGRSTLFAAVLGHPIIHSWSPSEHRNFFSIQRMPFFPIEIKEEEWSQAFNVLQRIGLHSAAITSPLKRVAIESCCQITDRAKELGSINTLVRHKLQNQEKWFGHNTDWDGFQFLLKNYKISDDLSIAIWGGGGTLQMVKSLLPSAHFFSSRTGQLRQEIRQENSCDTLEHYEIVVWAADPLAELPPVNWKPTCIVDLNYREDSRAREYAQLTLAKYISGEDMFRKQAKEQQEFWMRFLNEFE